MHLARSRITAVFLIDCWRELKTRTKISICDAGLLAVSPCFNWRSLRVADVAAESVSCKLARRKTTDVLEGNETFSKKRLVACNFGCEGGMCRCRIAAGSDDAPPHL